MSPGRLLLLCMVSLIACSSGAGTGPDAGPRTDWGNWTEGECLLAEGAEPPDSVLELGCSGDFNALASRPLDGSIPGARSSKTVVDTADGKALHFLNAQKYPMHYFFCAEYLSSSAGLPPVVDLMTFNNTEYYSPSRRFWLGAITFYEGPQVWTYEVAPYDTSSAEMVAESMQIISDAAFFKGVLFFHPTSEAVEKMAKDLPADIPIITTDDIYAGVKFLPLNPGTGIGQLRFIEARSLESGEVFVTPRDVVVLDLVPNDIPVVAGIITDELQTPLSHINVLSQNRGTPNMSLVGAVSDGGLRALEGKWVRLTVDPFDYAVEEVSSAEAETWWDEHKPPPIEISPMDTTVTELRDVADLGVEDIPAFGGKASHFGVLYNIGEPLRVPDGFAIPLYYYKQFEEENGLDLVIDQLLEQEEFKNSIDYRQAALAALRAEMAVAQVNPALLQMVTEKMASKLPQTRCRFRSSTNAEDLDGFTGAGLYTSKSGDPTDPARPIEDAMRVVWGSLWNLRAFEERSYRGIDHRKVGMAMLVHRSFPNEDANGVALTNNIFDATQYAFYINVQVGDVSVVRPPFGIVPDQILYFFTYPNQPATYLGHSTLMPDGETILTRGELHELGLALYAIHNGFKKLYAKPGKFYAMDVEFKFETGVAWVKQARPHYGWSGGGN